MSRIPKYESVKFIGEPSAPPLSPPEGRPPLEGNPLLRSPPTQTMTEWEVHLLEPKCNDNDFSECYYASVKWTKTRTDKNPPVVVSMCQFWLWSPLCIPCVKCKC